MPLKQEILPHPRAGPTRSPPRSAQSTPSACSMGKLFGFNTDVAGIVGLLGEAPPSAWRQGPRARCRRSRPRRRLRHPRARRRRLHPQPHLRDGAEARPPVRRPTSCAATPSARPSSRTSSSTCHARRHGPATRPRRSSSQQGPANPPGLRPRLQPAGDAARIPHGPPAVHPHHHRASRCSCSRARRQFEISSPASPRPEEGDVPRRPPRAAPAERGRRCRSRPVQPAARPIPKIRQPAEAARAPETNPGPRRSSARAAAKPASVSKVSRDSREQPRQDKPRRQIRACRSPHRHEATPPARRPPQNLRLSPEACRKSLPQTRRKIQHQSPRRKYHQTRREESP